MENQHDNQPETVPEPDAIALSSRSKVVRDTLVFQAKLACDGLRDVVLSPLSIAAAIAGIVIHPSKPDHYLRQLMIFGYKTDRWLNLFGMHKHNASSRHATSDAYVKKVEDMLMKDYQEGGLSKVVKNSTDKLVVTAQHEVTAVKSALNKTAPEPNAKNTNNKPDGA